MKLRYSVGKFFATALLSSGGLLVACGGGGDGQAGGSNSGRYALTISGAQLESFVSPFGEATIRRVDLLLDGTVVASRTFSPATAAGLIGTITDIRRAAGRHTLEFRIVDQTVTSSTYAVNPAGFVLAQDTQTSSSKVISLARDNALNPYTAKLTANQGIKIDFDLP